MTLQAVIDYLNDIKPNAFSENTLTMWVNECEGHIQTEIFCIDVDDIITYEYEADKDKELLVKPPHDKLYGMYLIAMTDFAYGEYSNYANTLQMYNAALDEFAKWYIRHHTSEGTNLHGYYISAYGIAVKHGFEGTEEEWLMTLKGDQGPQGIQGPQGEKGDPGAVSSVIAGDNNGTIIVDDGDPIVVYSSAADSYVTDIKSSVDVLQENLEDVTSVVSANEILIQDVIQDVNDLGHQISNEVNTRKSEDGVLLEQISAEVSARSQADGALQDNIDSEADIREQADIGLQELINAEVGTRAEKDNEIQTAISSEANARELLQNRVDALENASVKIDDTLTLSGAAADSKVVGDKLNEKEDKSNKVTELSNTSTDTQYPSAKAVYDELELKADKQNVFGGFSAGRDSQAEPGGAIGLFATTQNGAAIGLSAKSTYGGAVGSGAITDDGGAVGDSADASDGGGAVGCQARAEYGGGAIGKGAYAVRGFAGGERAYAPTDTIQLGTGTNTKSKTLQVYNYTVMEADGSLPYVHTARPYIRTENAETLELNTIYDLGIQTNLTLTLPSADYGNFIQVDFLSGDTATTLTISATSSALISDYDFVPESNKIYSLFFDYGRLDATNYGWRFSYAEYSYTPESEG